MSVSSILLGIFLVLSFVAPTVAWIIIRNMKPHQSDTLVFFFDTSRTGGVAICNLIDKKIVKNGRVELKVFPKTIENPKELPPIIVEANKIQMYPKNTLDKGKNIIIVYPEEVDSFYATMFPTIGKKNAENAVVYGLKEGMSRQQAHLVDMGEGELSRQNLALKNSTMNEMIKKELKEDKHPGKPGTYINPANREQFT